MSWNHQMRELWRLCWARWRQGLPCITREIWRHKAGMGTNPSVTHDGLLWPGPWYFPFEYDLGTSAIVVYWNLLLWSIVATVFVALRLVVWPPTPEAAQEVNMSGFHFFIVLLFIAVYWVYLALLWFIGCYFCLLCFIGELLTNSSPTPHQLYLVYWSVLWSIGCYFLFIALFLKRV